MNRAKDSAYVDKLKTLSPAKLLDFSGANQKKEPRRRPPSTRLRLGRSWGRSGGPARHRARWGQAVAVKDDRGRVVAIDRLGAGPGDRVLIAHGTRVRDLTVGEAVPLKDIIIAIVDGSRRAMILGRVVGEVWATRKHAALEGKKLVIVAPHVVRAGARGRSPGGGRSGGRGHGGGRVVCLGEPARRSLGGNDVPVEAAVAAIVDRVELAPVGERGARPLTFLGPPPAGVEL